MLELIFNTVLAAALLFFLIAGGRIPELSSAGDFVEAKGFPVMFSAIALVLLAADTVRMVRELTAAKRNGVGQAAGEFDSAKIYKVAIVLAMTVVYIVIVKTAGFVPLSVLFTFAALNLLKSRNQVFNFAFSLAAVLILTLIFGRFFGIALPRGVGILKTVGFYLY